MRYLLLLVCVTMTFNCTSRKLVREAQTAANQFQWDQAFQLWNRILQEDPDNTKAKIQLQRARVNAALFHLQEGTRYLKKDQLQEAAFELELALRYDPDNQAAQSMLGKLERRVEALAKQAQEDRSPDGEEAAFSSFPALEPTTWEPLDLYFPQPQDVREIYTAMGRAYGINILVDGKIRNDKISIDLRNLDFLKALDTLMVLNRHFFKIIDRNTLIILEDNKNNRERYTNQFVKTYYLSNITPNDLKNHLRQLGEIKEYAANDELNAITIKGTREQIALADKIISSNDKPQPEVVVEVELLEVNKTSLRKIGLLPVSPIEGQNAYSIGIIADPLERTDDDRNQGGLRGFFPSLDSEDILTILPAIAINFLKESGDTKQVANPHLRVTAGKEASILIGQKIPIATTSFTPIGVNTSGTTAVSQLGGQPLTSFNYNDVGIKLTLTPRVHHNDEITLDFQLEISSVVSQSLQPILGQRTITTTIRLKDGETNVLGGLLTNEERKSLTGIAGLADIPILGRLFSNDDKVVTQTDIILTLRPVIVRSHNIKEEDAAPYELSSLSLSSLYQKAGKTGHAAAKSAQAKPVQIEVEAQPERVDQPLTEPVSEPVERDVAEPPEPVEPEAEESENAEPQEAAASPAMLAFTPISISARQDDLIDVQVFATNVSDLQKGRLTVTFDPWVLQVESVELGSFLGPRGERPILTPAWDNGEGRVSMIVFQRPEAQPFSGSGILANIRFRAEGVGSGELVFDRIHLEDPAGNPLEAQGLKASFEVAP